MNGDVEEVEGQEEDDGFSQEEHEMAIHEIRWPDLVEEPEITAEDEELDREIDDLVWDAVHGKTSNEDT